MNDPHVEKLHYWVVANGRMNFLESDGPRVGSAGRPFPAPRRRARMGGTGGIGRHPGRKKRLASAEQTGTGPEGATSNPLLEAWVPPFGLPPFDRVTPDHFRPAFDRALAEHRAEIAAIAGDPATPTFANTLDAFQRAGPRPRLVPRDAAWSPASPRWRTATVSRSASSAARAW